MRNLMSREGKKWVEEGIISSEQYERIVSRYKPEKRSNLLPIFASILIGLSILTFIASNWDGIPHLVRVLIIVVGMTAFYISGEMFHRRGNSSIGEALIGIGVISFGAGIILLGQMFHFQSYDARAFIIWALAALFIVQLWKSKYFLLLAIVIITVGQLYSFISFSSFSYVLALLLLLVVSHFAYHRPHMATSVSFSISYLLHALFFVIHFDLNYQYLFAFTLVLYLISDLVKLPSIRDAVKNTALIGSIALIIFNVFWLDTGLLEEKGSLVYAGIIVLLLILFILRKRTTLDLADGLLFIPLFYMEEAGGVLYLLVLFIYSICLLLIGYQRHHADKATFGTVLFLLSSIVGYIQLAWDFMSKSLFFLLGGIVLFILSWFLEKNRRKLVKGEK